MGTILFTVDNLWMDLTHSGDYRNKNKTEQFWSAEVQGLKDSIGFKLQNLGYILWFNEKPFNKDEFIKEEMDRIIADYTIFLTSKICSMDKYCEGNPVLYWYYFVNNPVKFF